MLCPLHYAGITLHLEFEQRPATQRPVDFAYVALDDMAAGKGNEINEDGCEGQKDRRSSNTMNEMRIQCTIVFLFNWCTYTLAKPPRVQQEHLKAVERGEREGWLSRIR